MTNNIKQLYLEAISASARTLAGTAPWVRDLRGQAAERFAAAGFPTTRSEEWKYTDIGPVVRQAYPLAAANGADLAPEALERFWFESLAAHRVVFLNGRFAPELSSIGALPAGVTVGSLASHLAGETGEALAPHLGRYVPSESPAFAALNTALFADGAYVHLATGAVVEQPIHLLYLVTPQAQKHLVVPRNLVVAEDNSQAVIIENYAAAADIAYLNVALTEIVTGRNASVEHYRLQEESAQAYHIGGLHACIGRDSRFTSNAIDLGGRLVRNDVNSRLDAEGAECTLNGLYVLGGRQHVDNHTHIDHARPRGTSREFYKGILDGRSRAVFHGRVVVHPDAQQSDAQQVNNNLLLSRDAEADTKPQLEIYADDVKCSHGATVGQLDADALFYLRSRAIDEATARDLLTYAFARDLLTRIRLAPVRMQLERHLATGLMRGRVVEELVT